MPVKRKKSTESPYQEISKSRSLELWELGIGELTGHNIEASGRDEVNRLLSEGWILLHIYTLKYKEEDAWRERPMAILGKPRIP